MSAEADWADLELRPARPVDRDAAIGVGCAADAFDDWVVDPGGQFEVGEVYGVVVAVHRLRPIAATVVLYEGLAVAPDRRREGIGAEMLRRALASAREQGFGEMRLATADERAIALVEGAGFRLLSRCRTFAGGRVEGVDQPRLGSPDEADRLAAQATAAAAAYGGVLAGEEGPLTIDADLIRARAGEGRVRVGPSERAVALLLDDDASLSVGFTGGEGASLEELLFGLRVEADARGMARVRVRVPESYPSADRLEAAGYALDEDDPPYAAYARALS